MERGDVARLLNVAEADVDAYVETGDGLFVDVRDGGRRVITDDGIFGCDDHRANQQLRRWDGSVTDPTGAVAELATDEPEAAPAVAADGVPEGTADQVLAWVDGDPVRASQALAAEQKRGKPRATLVSALEKVAL